MLALLAADQLPPGRTRDRCRRRGVGPVALPALGALVLFLGGRRTDRFGHVVGVATVVLSFVYGAVLFVQALALPGEQRVQELPLYEWFGSGSLTVEFGLRLDPLALTFVLLITGVGSLIHIYSVGYMAHDPHRRKFFAIAQPLRRGDARARPGQRVPHPLPGLGGRRPGVVPAHRLLYVRPGRGGRRRRRPS